MDEGGVDPFELFQRKLIFFSSLLSLPSTRGAAKGGKRMWIARQGIEVVLGRVAVPSLMVAGSMIMFQGGLILIAIGLFGVVETWMALDAGAVCRQGSAWARQRKAFSTFGWACTGMYAVAWFRPELACWAHLYDQQANVVLGAVTPQSIRMSLYHPTACNAVVLFRPSFASGWSESSIAEIDSFSGTAIIALSQLEPGQTYEFKTQVCKSRVLGCKDSCVWSEEQELRGGFTTLPQTETKQPIFFASTSCLQRRLLWGKSFSGFAALAAKKPSFLLFLGDAIYTVRDGLFLVFLVLFCLFV